MSYNYLYPYYYFPTPTKSKTKAAHFYIDVVIDVTEAQKLWKLLSPKENLFDEWDFRYCFYKYFNYPLRFYVGYFEGQPIGLLPLQLNTDKGNLEFFGERYMEDNQVFIKKGFENYIPQFYKFIQQNAELKYITGSDRFTKNLELIDHKYVLPLADLTDGADYIETYFSGDTKKKFEKRWEKVSENDIKVEFGNKADLEVLMEYNLARFKEESSFNFPYRKQIYRDIFNLPYKTIIMTFFLNGRKEAVATALLHKGTYYSIHSTMHPEAVKDMATYVRMYKIEQAIDLGAQKFDAMATDCGWKENWHFNKLPQYKFVK